MIIVLNENDLVPTGGAVSLRHLGLEDIRQQHALTGAGKGLWADRIIVARSFEQDVLVLKDRNGPTAIYTPPAGVHMGRERLIADLVLHGTGGGNVKRELL